MYHLIHWSSPNLKLRGFRKEVCIGFSVNQPHLSYKHLTDLETISSSHVSHYTYIKANAQKCTMLKTILATYAHTLGCHTGLSVVKSTLQSLMLARSSTHIHNTSYTK